MGNNELQIPEISVDLYAKFVDVPKGVQATPQLKNY